MAFILSEKIKNCNKISKHVYMKKRSFKKDRHYYNILVINNLSIFKEPKMLN